jgi:Catalase
MSRKKKQKGRGVPALFCFSEPGRCYKIQWRRGESVKRRGDACSASRIGTDWVAGERGAADAERDARGFALKF